MRGSCVSPSLTSSRKIDTITGGSGDNTLYAGSGSDTITAGSGNNEIYGGAGYDILDGSAARRTGSRPAAAAA